MNRKILVVDDVMLATFFITNHLEESGFTNVHSFNDSTEAWNDFTQSLLGGDPYELVITDLNMPELDGMDFVRRIKSDPLSKDTHVFIVTADHDPLVMEEAGSHGVDAYLTKPVDLEDLEQTIKSIF